MKKERKARLILYPRAAHVEKFHDILIKQKGVEGYHRKEMIQGSLDWVQTEIFEYNPFPGVFERAAAILFAYTINHAFLDGNKRTALMTSSFFFFLNGYNLNIPEDSPEFTVSIVEQAAKAETRLRKRSGG